MTAVGRWRGMVRVAAPGLLSFAMPRWTWKHLLLDLDMAHCERGYLCDVCGDEVAEITDSDLYLRFVLGEVDARQLLSAPERHLRCNPTLTQFIVDERFEPVVVEGAFAKLELDAEQVRIREARVTAGYRRLFEVRELGLAIPDYPLPPEQ